MTNAPGAQGREPGGHTDARADAELFFPSEGTFSTVVPLSQVGRPQLSSGDPAAKAAGAPEEPEEMTLVPGRVSRRHPRATRVSGAKGSALPRLAAVSLVALSVISGVFAGAYLVGWQGTPEARQPFTPVEGAAAPEQAATEVPKPEPTPEAPPPAPRMTAETGDVVASAERAEPSADTPKASVPAASSGSRVAEPRAAARERAKAEAVDATPAPRLARREAAPPRRQSPPAPPRPPATAANGRTLPVSSPPPSARSKTVIQWP